MPGARSLRGQNTGWAGAPRSHVSLAGRGPGALGTPTPTELSWHKPKCHRSLQASGSLGWSGPWLSQPRWPDSRV